MVGEKIGRYKVLRLIGKGGMGQVFEALDEEIERRAAIKILHAQFSANPEMATRFLNEARAVNIIQHPSLVNAFEFGRLPDGSAYIVMEFLDGETLSQRLRRVGPLGLDSLRLARQIASALCAAHAKQIVHRDLKPSNIMVIPDADVLGGERVKVLDFGIAKLSSNQVPGQVDTRTGAILGSPRYMSPEQCRNVSTVDERTDVYSLGVILYEMLIGQPTFAAESDAETMAMQLYSEPIPLQQRDPQIQPELAAFVHRMLRKEPSERPNTREVLAFLNAHAGFPNTASMPHPIIARPSGSLTPVSLEANTLSRATGQGPPSRRRLTYLSAGVFAVLVIGLAAVGLLTRSRFSGGSAPPAGGTGAPQATIRWTLTSTPVGAEVIRQADKQLLGHTPWNQEQPRGDGTEVLLVRHPGYAEQVVSLDRSGSRELTLTLTALPAAPAPASAGNDERAPRTKSSGGKGADREKRRHPSKVTNADIQLIK